MLNQFQRDAVEQIDGPLLVIAGPGTGKTELLSMRTAQILKTTDTLPSSILCLTFTDSGAVAMRKRLTEIIGVDAYKVAIQTFHSFGSEVITQYPEYFYHGANMQPADDITRYEIMREIFDTLDFKNPLSSRNGGEYTYLSSTLDAISDLKRNGVSALDLQSILGDAASVIESIENDLARIFAPRISQKTIGEFGPIAAKAAALEPHDLPKAITPYLNILSLSIAHAVDAALDQNSTKPLTAWKNLWLEKNEHGDFILKDRKAIERLHAVAGIYDRYLAQMAESGLYDYDDMILEVIQALENMPDLAANLREKYIYIMVDEFQDTNLAQLRIIFNLTEQSESPNVMAVGDDDQGIFSFQGADVSNIHRFRDQYPDAKIVVLTDNYRSTAPILELSRNVITKASDRLENTISDLSKQLTPHREATAQPQISAYSSVIDEYFSIAKAIKKSIKDGSSPSEIAVIANRHQSLVEFVPYLIAEGIDINYERRENVLNRPLVVLLEQILSVVHALHISEHDEADALLPEIISNPVFGYQPLDIWKLSLSATRNHMGWLEAMLENNTFQPLALWLIELAAKIHELTFEELVDKIIGLPKSEAQTDNNFSSPLYEFFFADSKRVKNPTSYLDALESLRTVRDAVRSHSAHQNPSVQDFLDLLASYRELNANLLSVRARREINQNAVNLLSAHKSKGLEFDHVFVIGLTDNRWGERVSSRGKLIPYPANLPIGRPGANYDERIRLAYVAITRARQQLDLSYYQTDSGGKEMQIASFLADQPVNTPNELTGSEQLASAEIDWHNRIVQPISEDMRTLLAPELEKYKLSATHLSNFLDITKGGPNYFLTNNLLHFPQAKTAAASYGTAVHQTLQQAHNFISAHHAPQPIEDITSNFERLLREQYMNERDFDSYLARGVDALNIFLEKRYQSFSPSTKTELSFGGQNAMLDQAHLTGTLDLVDIDDIDKTVKVTDYKTGRPSRTWVGKSDYEKIKLHKYHQQLMFYQLLIENSRDYSKYRFTNGVLQFVEPTVSGDIITLESTHTSEELTEFKKLISAVWDCIITLQLPDISSYQPNITGIKQFEQDLIDKHATL